MTVVARAAWVLALAVLAVTCCNKLNADHIEEWECYIIAGGRVSAFKGPSRHMKLPCKYRLATLTCGDIYVKMIPGNEVDLTTGTVYPSTLWVKLIKMSTNETIRAHTSLEQIQMYNKGQIGNPWTIKEGSASFASMIYSKVSRGASMSVQWDIALKLMDKERLVKIDCNARLKDFQSDRFSLCGDGRTYLESAATAMYGNTSNSELAQEHYLHYLVMNDSSVRQSRTCRDMASRFQSCEEKDKPLAAEQCHHILADLKAATNQNQSMDILRDRYLGCLDSVCQDDATI